MTFNRRKFMAATAATASLMPAPSVHAQSKGKKYRTALIGSGWWGMNILREAISHGQTKVVALCDVDADKLELAAEEVNDLCGDQPKTYGDFRELLDKHEIDIAIIATPDHWHALNTLSAIESGAHIFVEKPTGHTILESRAMVDAAVAADRTVQVGLHRRVGPHYVSGMKFLRDGGAGDIGMIEMFVNSKGGQEKATRNSAPPETLDWEMYCGPAPMRPYNRKIHPGGFRNFLDFANGTLGDWGVHWLDQVLWWTDEKYPKTVYSTGGRPVRGDAILNDQEQTTDAPDSQIAVYEFESFSAVWKHRRFAGTGAEKTGIGCYFHGTKGTFHMGWRDGWTFYPSDPKKAPVHTDADLQKPDGHNMKILWADFIDSIESKRKPACDVQSAHLSTNLSLLGMMSLKLGRAVKWDGDKETVIDDPEANKLLGRTYRGDWKYPGS